MFELLKKVFHSGNVELNKNKVKFYEFLTYTQIKFSVHFPNCSNNMDATWYIKFDFAYTIIVHQAMSRTFFYQHFCFPKKAMEIEKFSVFDPAMY